MYHSLKYYQPDPVSEMVKRVYVRGRGSDASPEVMEQIITMLEEYEAENYIEIAKLYERKMSNYRNELRYLVAQWTPQGSCVYVAADRPKSRKFLKGIIGRHAGMSHLFNWMRTSKKMTYSQSIDFFRMMENA